MTTACETAVDYVLRRLQEDGRLAYLMGPGSETYTRLCAAGAERNDVSVEQFERAFTATLKPEPWRRDHD